MAKILALLILVALGSAPADAEVLELNRAGPTCDRELSACTLAIQIRGQITDATLRQFESLVEGTRRTARQADEYFSLLFVELNSPGGSIDAAMAIGRILRKEEAGAFVTPGAACLSACVLILAGGTTRQLDGTIGIHRPYFSVPEGDVTAERLRANYSSALTEIRNYLREMNVAERLADDMMRINPEEIRILKPRELALYGIGEIDPVTQEAFEINEAKKIGIDRREYMRRKLLAESQCGGPTSVGSGCYKSILKSGSWNPSDFSMYGR